MAKNIQIVVFSIGKEFYGLPIETVQEIVRVPDVTAVPDSPSFFEGVINLRGRIVPVVDLRARLRLPRAERGRATRVLITGNEGRVIGLLVDAVAEVRKLPSDAVEAPPEMIAAVGIEYITGVAKAGGRLIVFLDITKILSNEDMRRVAFTVEQTMNAAVA
jgi:purine-binding chemotaxis protein CheW